MRVYLIPAILALLSLVGLIVALIYDGPLEVLSSTALGTPVAAVLISSFRVRVVEHGSRDQAYRGGARIFRRARSYSANKQ
jgi:hypothetical protein